MRFPFRFRRYRVGRLYWLSFSSLCFGLILILLSPISFSRSMGNVPLQASINLQSTPTPRSPIMLSPTPATQAVHGKDVFWLHCMPCHGDQGQGLTDEFRFRQYPAEDTNCWKSGCHGARPYDNGFTLPKTIPALIGPGTLSHFATAQDMYNFVSKAMPFNKPGGLSQTEYLQAMAFILSRNQLIPADARIDLTSLASIKISQSATATPTSNLTSSTSSSAEMPPAFWGIIIFLIVATILSIVTRRRK